MKREEREIWWISWYSYGKKFYIPLVFRLSFLMIYVFKHFSLPFLIVPWSTLLFIITQLSQVFIQPKHPYCINTFTMKVNWRNTLCLNDREKIQKAV